MIKPRKSVELLAPYNPPLNKRSDFVRLDFNENTVGCSPKVLEALKSVTNEEISMYPDYTELRKLIANLNKIDPKCILPTNAGDEGIMLVLNTFVDKDEKIVLPSPTFAMFKFYSEIIGAKIVKVNYNKDLSFPINRVIDEIDSKTKIIVLVNPNNPTGTSILKEDIIEILKKAKDSIVLLDEAYFDFTGETCIDLINKFKNLIILRSFSKAYGLGGLRLGYLIANQEVISILQKVNSPYSITSLATRILKAAISDREFVKNYVNEIKQNKDYLCNELDKLNIKFYKGDANFLLVDYGKDYQKVNDWIKEYGILVRNRNSYVKNTLRITVGTKEQCENLIDSLKKYKINSLLKGIDTLLFDMDGVLIDVSNSYRLAILKTVEYFSAETSLEEIDSYKLKKGMNNDWDCTQTILKDKGIKIEYNDIVQEFNEILFNETIDDEKLILYEELIKSLSKKYKLGIVTGRPKKDTDYTLSKFKINEFFASTNTLDDVKNGKPDPEGLVKSLDELNSKNAVYIGDSVDDIVAANNARIISIGIAKDKKKILALNKAGAKFVLSNVNELLEVIKWKLQNCQEKQMKQRLKFT